MKRYFIAGILVFLVVLVASFPARIAYDWFAPPDLQLSGISGSIWNGKAAQALAAGAYIQDITWRFKPASIMSGEITFRTSGRPASGSLVADVGVSPGGRLALSDVSGNLPLDLIHPAFQEFGIRGDINLSFSSVIIQDGLPVDATGQITVANFFSSALSADRLGDYKAEFRTVDGNVIADVEDTAGVLDVAGQIALSPDRSYVFLGEVLARPDAPRTVTDTLPYLGSPDARGYRSFRFEGSL